MYLYSITHSTILLKLIVAVSDPLLFIRPPSIVLVLSRIGFGHDFFAVGFSNLFTIRLVSFVINVVSQIW